MLSKGVPIKAVNLCKAYGETAVLKNVSLTVAPGEFLALMGPSGGGKSTLLNLLGAMDVPDSGELWAGETHLATLTEQEQTKWRGSTVGFVFQFFNLLNTLTAVQNVTLPLEIQGISAKKALPLAQQQLEAVGLSHRLHHYPWQLSGGEMQRVAIARALVHQPRLLLADEPTGNLDSETGAHILELLLKLQSEIGFTAMMVTHSAEAAAVAHHCLILRDGEIQPEAVLLSSSGF